MAIPSSVRHFRPRVKAYARRADLIVAISEATARDVIDYLDVPREKVVVIYQGTTVLPKAPEDKVKLVRKKYMLDKEYILFVSRLDPRKNLARLFLAFERSGLSRDFDLVVAGPRGWHMEEMTKTWQSVACKGQIRWLDYIKDDELSALYGGATFLAFPSLLEGFGLPILEAMSVGCPVLTSNVSSMPEVGGNAALYVDPYDIDAMAHGLVTLAVDSALRGRLTDAGFERVKVFTWEKTARQMIEAYGRAYEIAGGRER
jgi:glycosyltransferase involved in cell wall biosynthesis